MINEIVVISGKGGTGKTTLTASLIPYFEDTVIADCDVDAPDLNILFESNEKSQKNFVGLQKAFLDKSKCIMCKKCYELCKYSSISSNIDINAGKCEGCGLCEYICPASAITMKDTVIGKLSVSETSFGDMVHAKLIPGEDASGKLVAEVRKTAKKIAEETNKKTILIDGSPGIACNVISSITGAKKVIIVTEATSSGIHDLKRVYELTKKFRLKIYVVINKYDLSISHSKKIEKYCEEMGIDVALKIPFQKKVVEAITQKRIPSVAEKDFFEKLGFFEFIEKLKSE
ncbi:ATP-binding protein [Ilyobacter polytropus]|uniref:Cobyrinic acid ac-diamide synthase n=1 Tax=Ilyobacter polytropus (strain ATCC 51220 / DSM 2926 / LMG 16218 / CuHBu1) TaxID=572544 RepID=E3H8V5_ILYPC|nr:ATP-binding protein [Ilyobacter polytropus]ADO83369.1 Cobyrinic acid ac-diamide synthase [Ilyobacter polytropus DSM 2926]